MLLNAVFFILAFVLLLVFVSYAVFFVFLRRLNRTEWVRPDIPFTPKTLILFPLRGADPSLPVCLEKVLTQDYPDYFVRFILDSAHDPALPYIESALAQWGQAEAGTLRGEIKIMPEPLSTCALKCSAHLHGIADLDTSFAVLAVLDADTNPPADWLMRLVEPLSDSRFTASTGMRWYIPERGDSVAPSSGSVVRYLWNAAAIVMQYIYKIPWGGSMAFRRELLSDSTLPKLWRHAFTDDNPVAMAVREVDGQIAIVPSLFLANRESCGLRSFHRWVQRQMLMNKLYTPVWWAIVGQAVANTLPLILLLGLFVAGLIVQDIPVVFWSCFAFILYWAGVCGTLPIMELTIRKIVQQHGEPVEKWSFYRTLLTFAMVPVTQAVYTSAIFWLHFLRKIEWRGIEYEISCSAPREQQVKMLAYKPYSAPQDIEGQSRQSL